MGCEPFQTADGARGFICTRGRKLRKKCACGRVAALLCDGPILIGTCDAPICERCAITVGDDLHHCPKCARSAPIRVSTQMPIPAHPSQASTSQASTRRPEASAREVEAMEHDSRLDGSVIRDGWPMPWRILPASQLPSEMLLQLHGELSAQLMGKNSGGHHGG